MKKSLSFVVLAGLLLTGCATEQASAETPASATTSAKSSIAIDLPNVVGLTLDTATDQLEDLGLEVEATDIKDDKSIFSKKNWQVVSEDPATGASVTKGSTVKLGVRHLTDETATPTPTPTAVPAEVVVPIAPPVVEAPPAPVEAPPAPALVEPPAAPPAPPVVEAPPAPPAVPYYKNCDAVRAAGAAPIHISQPGYHARLDKDGDGWGCDK